MTEDLKAAVDVKVILEAISHVEKGIQKMDEGWADTYGEVINAAKKYVSFVTLDSETRLLPKEKKFIHASCNSVYEAADAYKRLSSTIEYQKPMDNTYMDCVPIHLLETLIARATRHSDNVEAVTGEKRKANLNAYMEMPDITKYQDDDIEFRNDLGKWAERNYRRLESALKQPDKTVEVHEWDKDGERCIKCGDKDWRADTNCKPKDNIINVLKEVRRTLEFCIIPLSAYNSAALEDVEKSILALSGVIDGGE